MICRRNQTDTRSAQRGMTLIELLTASLLAAFIMMGLVRLLDLTLDMWAKGEVRREGLERSNTVLGLLADDLRSLHGGGAGDLVIDWQPFDHDGDGLPDRTWPRLRFVRQVDAGALQRLRLRDLTEVQREAYGMGSTLAAAAPPLPDATGLIEVAWAVLPADRSDDPTGILLRGERLLGDDTRDSLMGTNFFRSNGAPAAGSLLEVGGGILWLGIECATQTSLVREGWHVGGALADACTSWDAYRRERPDLDLTPRNEPGAGMPAAGPRPILPRRIRIVLEMERAKDQKRRTTLLNPVTANTTRLEVDNGERLPAPGGFVWVAGEWMEVVGVSADHMIVRRGARETRPRELPMGAMVHYGKRVVIEVPIPLHEDDWRVGN